MIVYLNDRTPFLYLIGWTDLNISYIGIRYAKGCHPCDLWRTYFTSSKYVAELRDIWGEPDIVEVVCTGDKAVILELEATVIAGNDLHNSSRWLNRTAGNSNFAARPRTEAEKQRAREYRHTPEALEKISLSSTGRKQRPATIAKRAASNSGYKHDDAARQKMSDAASNRTVSDDTRAKMSASRTGQKRSEEAKANMRAAQQARFARERADQSTG